VAPHKLKRSLRGVIAATAILAAVGSTVSATVASATPTTTADALKQYQDLTQKAEVLKEGELSAQVDLDKKNAQLTTAKQQLSQAQDVEKQAAAKIDQYRGQVDALSSASLSGANLGQASALLGSSNLQDYLDEASAIQVIADNNNAVLTTMRTAVGQTKTAADAANAAQTTAQQATDAAAKLLSDVQQQETAANAQIAIAKAAYDKLSAADKTTLVTSTSTTTSASSIIATGTIATVIDFAKAQIGKSYVWAATGPDSYDCSGLTMKAFATIGVTLPHSSATQSTMGTAVARADLQIGDLVFFGSPVHHVGIYVGNNQMIDAPTEGVPVGIHNLYSDYSGARRLV
jgi:cell wall-associated NlpC family hydrolase